MLESTGFSLEGNNNLLFTICSITPFKIYQANGFWFMRAIINGYHPMLRFKWAIWSQELVYNTRYQLDR